MVGPLCAPAGMVTGTATSEEANIKRAIHFMGGVWPPVFVGARRTSSVGARSPANRTAPAKPDWRYGRASVRWATTTDALQRTLQSVPAGNRHRNRQSAPSMETQNRI